MRLAPATVCVSAASFLAERGGKSVRERWKFIARSFRAPPPRWCRRYVEAKFQTLNDDQIKRNTPTAAHTTIHATCQKKKKKETAKPKAAKNAKKPKRRKIKIIFMKLIWKQQIFVLFIRRASMKLVLLSVVLGALKSANRKTKQSDCDGLVLCKWR